jgi:hypothetical protein
MAMPAVVALQGSAKCTGRRVHMGPCQSVVIGRYAPSSREGYNLATMAGLDEAFPGRSELAMLVGQPGIGKTRMSQQLVPIAVNPGLTITGRGLGRIPALC